MSFKGVFAPRRGAMVAVVGALALASAGCITVPRGPVPPPPAPVQCGAKVTADFVLPNDLTCAGDGLAVQTPGVTIDLAGHTIKSTGNSPGVGIFGFGVSVKNGTISGFATGVQDGWSGNPDAAPVTVDGVHFVGNNTGILMAGDAISMTNTTFDGSGVTSIGLIMGQKSSSSADDVAHNEFDNLTTGIAVSQWVDATIEHNRFVKDGVGVSLEQSGSIAVTDNEIGFSGTGIRVSQENDDVTISGNTVHDGLVGIWVTSVPGFPNGGSTNNTISGNSLSDNGAAGLAVVADWAGFTGMSIAGNTASGNGAAPGNATNAPVGSAPLDDGIYVNVAAGSTVTVMNNQTSQNADHGIEAVGVTDGGGNSGAGNHGSSQCVGVVCS